MILLNESGNLTFRRFGISKYNQYSIFRSTFQCHWTRITETIFTNLNGFQWFTIQYVEWFRLVVEHRIPLIIIVVTAKPLLFHLSEWIDSDFDRFQSIQSFDFECFHWSKTIIANFDWFNTSESREIKYCVINIVTSPIRNDNRCNGWIDGSNEIKTINCCREELCKCIMDI